MGTSKNNPKKKSPTKKKATAEKEKSTARKTRLKLNNTALMPSEVYDIPWIFAERKKGNYPDFTDNSGKWLIYVWDYNIDLVWEMIKSATENGLLGLQSKVSTMMPSPLAPKPNLKVIYVYTYDFTDKDDVMRIREELRKIGVTNKIGYKADDATRQLQYSFNRKGRVTLYYE